MNIVSYWNIETYFPTVILIVPQHRIQGRVSGWGQWGKNSSVHPDQLQVVNQIEAEICSGPETPDISLPSRLRPTSTFYPTMNAGRNGVG